jgi:hypothetical protein
MVGVFGRFFLYKYFKYHKMWKIYLLSEELMISGEGLAG